MEEIGKVIKIDNNNAIIEIEPKGGCGICGMKMFCNPAGTKIQFSVINRINAKINDTVKIEIKSTITLLAGFLIFIAPIIIFAIGYIIGNAFAKVEIRLLCGAIFLLTYLFLLKKINAMAAKSAKFKPIITQIIKATSSIGEVRNEKKHFW